VRRFAAPLLLAGLITSATVNKSAARTLAAVQATLASLFFPTSRTIVLSATVGMVPSFLARLANYIPEIIKRKVSAAGALTRTIVGVSTKRIIKATGALKRRVE